MGRLTSETLRPPKDERRNRSRWVTKPHRGQRTTLPIDPTGVESPSEREILADAIDIEAPLTLELNGDDITPEIFVRGVRSFFAVLNEVTDQIDDTVGWRIQVKQGSNLIGVYPRGPTSPSVARIINSVEAGLAAIEHAEEEPEEFTERALVGARDLAKLALASDGGVTVKVWADKRAQYLSARSVTHVDDILGDAFEEHGAIIGKIQTVSERGGARFIIYDDLTDRAIRCVLSEDRLDDAMRAFGHRCEIYGMIRYRKDGQPNRMKVEDIVVFPPDSELPSAEDVRGMLRNMPR